jgi:hypothetical protein
VTHTGRYRAVLKAWSRPFDGPVYKFFTEYGSFELTGEHPVLLERGWVNAQDVQAGEKVLYTGVNIPFDLVIREADDDPSLLAQNGVAFSVPDRIVPVQAVAFNGDLTGQQGEINNMPADGKLISSVNAPTFKGVHHNAFDVGGAVVFEAALHGTTKVFVCVGTLDPELLAAITADQSNRVVLVNLPIEAAQMLQSGIILSFDLGDFATDFGSLRWIIIAGQVQLCVDALKVLAGDAAESAIILLPLEECRFLMSPHRDASEVQQGAEGAVGYAQCFAGLGSGLFLTDVQVIEDISDQPSSFAFNAECMVFRNGDLVGQSNVHAAGLSLRLPADGAIVVHDDNLSSLSLGSGWGLAPRSAIVKRFMRPFQALLHYTTIQSVEVRHYEGPVYNMHVDRDNSYTVNGACVHNCLCTIVPEATATPAQVTADLREAMTAGPADGELYTEREQMQGAFNLDWLIEALLMGYFMREVVGSNEEQAA